MCDQYGLDVLLPHLAELVVERADRTRTGVVIWAHPRANDAACPSCGARSARVHSRYDRTLADAGAGGQQVAWTPKVATRPSWGRHHE